MKPRSSTSSDLITCQSIDLQSLRRLEPIPSGFATDRVYRLRRQLENGQIIWRLVEERLPGRFTKTYDEGRVDEWLASYADPTEVGSFRFVCAYRQGRAVGLLTWRSLTWNNTFWLIDIRAREAVRRTGVGSALLRHLHQMARSSKMRGISVETQINNHPAIQFYRKHGYAIVGFNDHLYTNQDYDDQDVALYLFWEAP